MQRATATVRGDATIEAWITHCPACNHPVWVPAEARAVACPECHTAFAPEALDTATGPAPASSPPSDADDPLLGQSLGPWRLVRLIGRGGMGRVYEATDATGRRRVALKILSGDLAADPAFVKRFHREARVLSSLEHPHVVEILDRGEHEGQLWFAMEYVRGENLRRRIHRARLPVGEAVRIAREIASALSYAHDRGVVHRDLKPENVLLDEAGRVHLVDFGLSRLPTDDGPDATTLLTRTDVILGTYEYMAPEQRRGEKDLDGRADVYALGVILYEMLTGALPLGHYDAASRLRPEVPPVLDEVVNRALATDRGRRYASADAFREGLDAAWAARKSSPKRTKVSGKPGTVALGEPELAALKPVLRHVDVISTLDRVLGMVMLLAFVGWIGGATLERLFWLRPFGLLLLIGGIVLLRQGGRLSRMAPGSREGQVTTSVILLLLPPVGTLIGIYALKVLTGDDARMAFQVGRKALEGPRPVVAEKVVRLQRPPSRRAAPPWMHLLLLVAIVWAVYSAVLIGTTSVAGGSLEEALHSMPAGRLQAVKLSAAGTVLALVALIATFRRRKVRHGFGMAITAFALFLGSTWFLSGMHEVRAAAKDRSFHHRGVPSLPSPLTLESRR